MRNAGGYMLISGPDGTKEADTFSCGHCNAVTIVKPMVDPASMGGLCGVCSSLLCARCAGAGRCDPLEEKLLRAEASDAARRSYGI